MTYCYSTDEEDCFVGGYATREEALGAGCETALDEQRTTVWTGIMSGVPARFVDDEETGSGARVEDVEEHDVAEVYAEACQQHIAELRAVTAERDALQQSTATLDRVRPNADAITPSLLSHYEHALDEADASQPGRAVPSTQRASALRRAQVYRDLLVAIGHESACSVARGERLARLEGEAGR